MLENLEKKVREIACGLVVGLALVSGCGSSQGVKGRLGSTPSLKIGRSCPDYHNLGTHNTSSEKKGQIYCCKGGFIDIAHLRKGADFANVYTNRFFTEIMNNNKEFTYKMKEPCTYHVKMDFPSNWDSLSLENKKELAEYVAIQLGEYSSFLGTTWHEVLTWYGYKMTGIIPEFHSALTIDDNFSNFLGSYIAARVLEKNKQIFNNPERKLDKRLFNEKFTSALTYELEKLGAQSPLISKKACGKSSDKYRHLDIGLDGYMSAYLLPRFSDCGNAEPTPYPAPNLDFSKYGFSVQLGIDPHDGAGRKMRSIAGKEGGLVVPDEDFPAIIKAIEKSAIRKGLNPVY